MLTILFLVVRGVTVGEVHGATVLDGELDQLLRSDEDTRRRWLDDRQPVPPEPNWWLHLLLVVDGRGDRRPAERPAWAQLKIWLLGQAGRRSALDQVEVAERTAYYVAQMRSAGMAASSLPSADTVVRACLDAIPVAIDHVAVLTDRRNLYALERQEMIDSRHARHLLNAAERHQDDLDDPALADRLHAWLAIKPRLV
ncbi:hypothetical protein [Actinoplanes palleronii]|uniref:Uncharacterized protein n=1 Tax=Actinoplanes palleronii TaxID=113570 RepID=A0ABQ4BTG9_9ACTN|nr:hypothetical protein [Actinoplanes palleronii]GIE73969.1 hypothetical protein Apa02nite_100770 [Actinoplanes palleronii]